MQRSRRRRTGRCSPPAPAPAGSTARSRGGTPRARPGRPRCRGWPRSACPASDGSEVCSTVFVATTRAKRSGAAARVLSPMGPPQSWTTSVTSVQVELLDEARHPCDVAADRCSRSGRWACRTGRSRCCRAPRRAAPAGQHRDHLAVQVRPRGLAVEQEHHRAVARARRRRSACAARRRPGPGPRRSSARTGSRRDRRSASSGVRATVRPAGAVRGVVGAHRRRHRHPAAWSRRSGRGVAGCGPSSPPSRP